MASVVYFQGSVGPVLRWDGQYVDFVENLIIFPTVQKLWKSVNLDIKLSQIM